MIRVILDDCDGDDHGLVDWYDWDNTEMMIIIIMLINYTVYHTVHTYAIRCMKHILEFIIIITIYGRDHHDYY